MSSRNIMSRFKLKGQVPRATSLTQSPLVAVQRLPTPAMSVCQTFQVTRTSSNQLPVYREVRAGGTHITTKIQRITGSPEALMVAIVEHTGIPADRIQVSTLTGQVVCKGDYALLVKTFLKDSGF